MAAAVIAGLAVSAACDGTDALPDVRPRDWLDGAAGTLGGGELCRVAGVAPRGRGTAAAEPQAKAGLGRPRGTRRPGPAAPQVAAQGSAGDARHVVALAPAAGWLVVDLSSQGRTAAC